MPPSPMLTEPSLAALEARSRIRAAVAARFPAGRFGVLRKAVAESGDGKREGDKWESKNTPGEWWTLRNNHPVRIPNPNAQQQPGRQPATQEQPAAKKTTQDDARTQGRAKVAEVGQKLKDGGDVTAEDVEALHENLVHLDPEELKKLDQVIGGDLPLAEEIPGSKPEPAPPSKTPAKKWGLGIVGKAVKLFRDYVIPNNLATKNPLLRPIARTLGAAYAINSDKATSEMLGLSIDSMDRRSLAKQIESRVKKCYFAGGVHGVGMMLNAVLLATTGGAYTAAWLGVETLLTLNQIQIYGRLKKLSGRVKASAERQAKRVAEKARAETERINEERARPLEEKQKIVRDAKDTWLNLYRESKESAVSNAAWDEYKRLAALYEVKV